MGQTYHTEMHLSFTDKAAATQALRDFINKNNHHGCNFSIEDYAEKNINPDNFDDIMRIIFTTNLEISDDKTIYESTFDATYGWGSVIEETFKTLAPFLTDDAYIYYDTDSASHEIYFKDGKMSCVSEDIEDLIDEDNDDFR